MKNQALSVIIAVLILHGFTCFAEQKDSKSATEVAEELARKLKKGEQVEGLKIHKVK